VMGMHAEFAITCDVCHRQHDDADFYPDQAKQRARADGWIVDHDSYAPTCAATCPRCQEVGQG
jgi:hypothetical protein